MRVVPAFSVLEKLMGDLENEGAGQLRLLARERGDIEVLSALLQDAIILVEDMVFERESKRFIIVANRFCWDLSPVEGVTTQTGGPVFQRRLCGVQFAAVKRVRQTGLPVDRRSGFLNLLAITTPDLDSDTDPALLIDLLFSGGASVRLEMDEIHVQVEDIDAPQPTGNQPLHEITDKES